MITIKVYKTGSKIKSKHCTSPCGYRAETNGGIIKIIRDNLNEDFQFIDVNNDKKDITYSCLLRLIKELELSSSKIDLTKVIRSGGFVEYIKTLEARSNGV